ncbi:MAG TPA: hypothetical protein VN802_04915 [Stellaceae bacterium]|nr:hypothetical protein [Stellaceae bacterium]
MARDQKHPERVIEEAVRHAEALGWAWRKGGGHAWGIIRCPWNDRACRNGTFCQASIWSTPRNPTNHARHLERVVDKCIHVAPRDPEDESDDADA